MNGGGIIILIKKSSLMKERMVRELLGSAMSDVPVYLQNTPMYTPI